jgi:hypothetical protein
MKNLESFGVEIFVGECMATILGNANNMSQDFNRVRWKTIVYTFIIDLLPEVKSEKRNNVNSNSRKTLEWNTAKFIVICMIKYITNILKTQNPGVVRGVVSIKDAIGSAFDCLVATLSWVLLLLMRV